MSWTHLVTIKMDMIAAKIPLAPMAINFNILGKWPDLEKIGC